MISPPARGPLTPDESVDLLLADLGGDDGDSAYMYAHRAREIIGLSRELGTVHAGLATLAGFFFVLSL